MIVAGGTVISAAVSAITNLVTTTWSWTLAELDRGSNLPVVGTVAEPTPETPDPAS
jgi:hypothetical protein